MNIWGGHVRDPLHNFISSYKDVDIFCLQEVYHNAKERISIEDRKVSLNIYAELQALLQDHLGYFKPTVDGIYGISMFINKQIEVIAEGDHIIYHNPTYSGRGPAHSRKLQWATCRVNDEIFTIMNVHGLWNGMGKSDSEERISQSNKIKQFMDAIHSRKILCGDFNLKPDTKSLTILANEMNNLIDAYKISSTRTSFYLKPEKFADYIFTSNDIKVNKFEVLKDEVSDHSPLLLDFS